MPQDTARSRLKLLYEIPHNFADTVGDKATFHLSGEHLQAALGGQLGLSKLVIGPVESRMGKVGLTLHHDQDGRVAIGVAGTESGTELCDYDFNGYDMPQNSGSTSFLVTAGGMKLSPTEIDLAGADEECCGQKHNFGRGLGITLQKLDNGPTTGSVSFVQLLLVRSSLASIPIPLPIWQQYATAEIAVSLSHCQGGTCMLDDEEGSSRSTSRNEVDECITFLSGSDLRNKYGISSMFLERVSNITVLSVNSAIGPVGLTMHHDEEREVSIESPTRTVFVSGVNGCAMAYHHVVTPMNAFERHSVELKNPADFSAGICLTLHKLTFGSRNTSAANSEVRLELKYLQCDAPNR